MRRWITPINPFARPVNFTRPSAVRTRKPNAFALTSASRRPIRTPPRIFRRAPRRPINKTLIRSWLLICIWWLSPVSCSFFSRSAREISPTPTDSCRPRRHTEIRCLASTRHRCQLACGSSTWNHTFLPGLSSRKRILSFSSLTSAAFNFNLPVKSGCNFLISTWNKLSNSITSFR